jgi:ribonuclease P protein component
MSQLELENTFTREERLKSGKEIDKLFSRGKKFSLSPLRIFWRVREREEESEIKIMISVPKKIFSRAVDRNLIKRRIREAYRQHKQLLPQVSKTGRPLALEIAFIYNSKDIIEYHELETKIISVLQGIAELL